jgi:hypothetical protein
MAPWTLASHLIFEQNKDKLRTIGKQVSTAKPCSNCVLKTCEVQVPLRTLGPFSTAKFSLKDLGALCAGARVCESVGALAGIWPA